MSGLAARAIGWTEQGLVPDGAVRAGIRRLLSSRLCAIQAGDVQTSAAALEDFIDASRRSEIAPLPQKANEQHYELPPAFFELVLGAHNKYSCCYFASDDSSLDEAEHDGLRLSCQRAGIKDGMTVLDLGCGWGSLSLFIADRFPRCRVTSVSNSNAQRRYIEAEAARRGLGNIEILTRDMNDFAAPASYDRIVSVEMFEHMRNYEQLFGRIKGWLNPGGRFFMHIFCHRSCAYAFEDEGPGDWMSRHFFSGGIMPSSDLPLRFQRDLHLERRWIWDGRHYERTANAWLRNIDARKHDVMPLMSATYGPERAAQWFMRWRIFFMACAELFGYADGQEWMVGHYLFSPRTDR